MFEHEFVEVPTIERVNVNGKRQYKVPSGQLYPSITTVLSATKDYTGLNKWKESVGEQVAEYIMKQSLSIGSTTHEHIEYYLKNDVLDKPDLLPKAHFEQIKPFLNNIGTIYGIELFLYSDTIKVAGTSDCIAMYKGKRSVIDFKTSRKKKRLDWVQDYFIQATAYSMMWGDHFTTPIEQIVIIITAEDGTCEEYIESPLDYKDTLLDRIDQYYKR